jgi:hypothetical protein
MMCFDESAVLGFVRLSTYVLLLAILLAGCGDRSSSRQRAMSMPQAERLAQPVDYLSLAVQRLGSLDRHGIPAANQAILDHLNQWGQTQQAAADWVADPLFSRLPAKFDAIKASGDLASLVFRPDDISMLQEAMWMRDTARRVAETTTEDFSLAKWLSSMSQAQGADSAKELAAAERLFDWTVRNVELDPFPQTGNGPTSAGVRPGARHFAWESLLLGHGDAWERSRIFVLLARQLGIDVVMLAVDDGAGDDPTPWLAAALVESRLYLFDSQLGLPVPGPGGEGIAHLEEVIQQPELLRQLDLAPDALYGMRPFRLESILALVDATPAYLSQRMWLLQSRLAGEDQLVLTVSPASISQRLRRLGSIRRVNLWNVPLEAIQLKHELAQDRTRAAAWLEEHRLVTYPTLAVGRNWHLRARLTDQSGQPGAIHYYLECLVPDQEIPQRADQLLRAEQQLPQHSARQEESIEEIQHALAQIKQTASYWLGLIQFDRQEYEAAVHYFKKGTSDAVPDGLWSQGSRYNLARSYEAIGLGEHDAQKLQLARSYYLQDHDSPQRHGNQLRARRLDSLLATPAWSGQ